MTYSITHTDDDCDKCLKTFGKENLKQMPFIFLDKNDDVHKDVICPMRGKLKDYKQYFVCEDCFENS